MVMAFCGVVPIAFVFFYSVHDVFAGNSYIFVGTYWFESLLASREFWGALLRSLGFSALVLLIEVPLGIYVALRLPARGLVSSILVVLLAIPLLAPTIVVGYLWKVLTLPKTGLLTAAAGLVGFDLNMNDPVIVWAVLLLMDAWHWTSLVVLLCFAGLRAIPDAYYQAARIDGASRFAVFRYIQLPKLRGVLMIAVLLRFMDSFMIYTEPFVLTGGGPGNATTFLSQYLTQKAVGQFDLGPAAAFSLIYFLIILLLCFILYNWMQRVGTADREGAGHG